MITELVLAGAGLGLTAVSAWPKPQKSMKVKLEAVIENIGMVVKVGKVIKRPLVVKQTEKPYGFDYVISLPEGISILSFLKCQQTFEYAMNAELEMEQHGSALTMKAYCKHLPPKKSYRLPEDWETLTEGMELPIPVGYSRKGLEIGDLAEYPHLLVGGHTFGGKSNFLHQAIANLLHCDRVKFYVIDLAKAEFAYLQDHAWFASDLPTTVKMLGYLRREMERRLNLLVEAKCVNWGEYRQAEDAPYLVLLVDELSQLSPALSKGLGEDEKSLRKEAHARLIDLLCLARKCGIHIILSTQRPDRDILPGQMKANMPAVICFKTINDVNSQICLDNERAAYLPAIRGRAVYQFDVEREVQVMHLPIYIARSMLPDVPLTKPLPPVQLVRKEKKAVKVS